MRWHSASELGQKYATKNYPSQGTQICKLHGPSIKPSHFLLGYFCSWKENFVSCVGSRDKESNKEPVEQVFRECTLFFFFVVWGGSFLLFFFLIKPLCEKGLYTWWGVLTHHGSVTSTSVLKEPSTVTCPQQKSSFRHQLEPVTVNIESGGETHRFFLLRTFLSLISWSET